MAKMRWRYFAVVGVGAVLVLMLLLVQRGSPSPRAETIAPIGAWCWFADPRAIEYGDRVVFGWVDDDGSIVVGDDRGQRFTLQSQLQRDDHNSPAFYVRGDGRLTAFWSAHIGQELYYRTTAVAGSIDAWGPVHTAPANPPGAYPLYTYPNPVSIGDTLYLF